MGYYLIKKATISESGITVEAADSNTFPRSYFNSSYEGTITDFFKSVYEGNFKLMSSVSKKIRDTAESAENVIKTLIDQKGLSWDETRGHGYEIPEREKAINVVCEWFALRFHKSAPSVGYSDMAAVVGMIVAKGVESLEAQKNKEREQGVINIGSAAVSIFEGYDLLAVKDTNELLLAPKENYNNGGKLKTDKEKDVWIPPELGNVWNFLSFTGVDMTLDEYIQKAPGRESEIRAHFSNVDKVVDLALGAGLHLREGITPYNGWNQEPETPSMSFEEAYDGLKRAAASIPPGKEERVKAALDNLKASLVGNDPNGLLAIIDKGENPIATAQDVISAYSSAKEEAYQPKIQEQERSEQRIEQETRGKDMDI